MNSSTTLRPSTAVDGGRPALDDGVEEVGDLALVEPRHHVVLRRERPVLGLPAGQRLPASPSIVHRSLTGGSTDDVTPEMNIDP